ncbi:hypothetical protein MOD31_00260 [Paenarthrobacter sp. TYUT067]|uniref:hypothetical protein n=1 Tax=Paenarthrobacter sp. TYUT067 TaxID=2926245 RepID=UPI00202F5A74|nr:hypothetical protein [Paenarthrobacter sp. TYUT067]MCM0614449.1 hypothetical protein [Paenarthrobacter sp. TYUT067]
MESTQTERISSVIAGLFVLVAVLIAALRGLLAWDGNEDRMLGLALWVVVISGGPVIIMVLIQRLWRHRFRAPSGREIWADFSIGLIGIPISIPLLVVGLDGKLFTWSDSLIPALLLVVATMTPAIRPRSK